MKLYLCVLGILVLTSTAIAEEVTRKEGDKSLNFSLSRSELQVYKFGFGGKYWTSSDVAYSGSLDVADDEVNTTGPYGLSTMDDSYYALSLAREKHFQTSSRLSPYIGGELKCSIFQSENTFEYAFGDSKSRNTGRQYSVSALAGAEYALNKNVSLSGEYAFGFNYRVSKYHNTLGDQTTRSKGFDLSVGRLTLLLYF